MKRVISAVLTIAMTLGLFASVNFVNAMEYSGKKQIYTFNAVKTSWQNPDSASKNDLRGITYDYTSDGNWKWFGASAGVTTSATTARYYSSVSQIDALAVNQWAAYTIKIDAVGKYDVSFEYRKLNVETLGAYDVYIIPATTTDIDAALTADSKIASVDGYDADVTAWAYDTVTGSTMEIATAGEYLMVLKQTRSGGMRFRTLTLDGVKAGTFASLNCSIDKPNITVSGTSTISFSALDSAGGKLTASDMESIAYESLNNTVADVNSSGKVTGISEGNAKIKVTATKGSITKEQQIDVSVSAGVAPGQGVLTYLLHDYSADWATGTQTSILDITYDKMNGGLSQYNGIGPTEAATGYSVVAYKSSKSKRLQINNMQVGQWTAFDIKVSAAGSYAASMDITTYGTRGSAGACEVYLVPKNATAVDSLLSSSTQLGSADFFDSALAATAFGQKKIDFGNINILNAGEYTLVFKQTTTGALRIENFVLDGSPTETFASLNCSIGGGTVTMGLSASIVFSAKGTNGSDYTASDMDSIEYSSVNESIATVDADGVVRGISTGSTKIKVKATMGSVQKEQEIDITVVEPVGVSGEIESYLFGLFNDEWNPLSSDMGFSDATRSDDVRGITYAYTTTGNWEWFATSPSWTPGPTGAIAYAGGTTERLQINISGGSSWAALAIKVPKKGKYQTKFDIVTYGTRSSAGISDVYIIPKASSNIEAALTPSAYVGELDYYDDTLDATSFGTKSLTLNEMTFNAEGEYLLVLKQKSSGAFRIKSLTLDGAVLKGLECTAPETVSVGEEASISFVARNLDGSEINRSDLDFVSYEALDSAVKVDDNGKITGISEGSAKIEITAELDGVVRKQVIEITCIDTSEPVSLNLTCPSHVNINSRSNSAKMEVTANMKSGAVISVPMDTVEFEVDNNSLISINSDFTLKGLASGTAKIRAKVTFRGKYLESEWSSITVEDGMSKTAPAIYTEAKRQNANENASKYAWAQSIQKSAIRRAEKYLGNEDIILNQIVGEGVPRGRQVGARWDPEYNLCRYCGTDIVGKYGASGDGGWKFNILLRPWKLECPECKRIFPSNDFAGLLEIGKDEHGYYNRELAHERNDELIAKGEKGYLANTLYPEAAEQFGDPNWGVDDAWGYIPKDENGNPRVYKDVVMWGKKYDITERHTYVACYYSSLWGQLRADVIPSLIDAYNYTGDSKYGIIGALITDRIADVYPGMDIWDYQVDFFNTHGSSWTGKINGNINDCTNALYFAMMTDAFYPMVHNPNVQSRLQKTAEDLKLDNDKSTPEKIWQNWENGILIENFEAAKRGDLKGNFGMLQNALATTAVSLDDPSKTDEILKWTFQYGERLPRGNTGGNVLNQLIDVVDRDGMGNEAAPNYNAVWIQNMIGMTDVLTNYKGDGNYNLFENPKLAQMFYAFLPITLVQSHHAQIGDSGATASVGMMVPLSRYVEAFEYLKNTPHAVDFAKYMYMRNGYKTDDLHYNIFTKNPESIQDDIERCIEDFPKQKSEIMTGYGFAVLRDGIKSVNATNATKANTLRDFWISFGRTSVSHAHPDSLNIGMEAYGLNFMPDLGYPINTVAVPNNVQWSNTSISHNLVLVNGAAQSKSIATNAFPLHFDDADSVKLFDVESPKAYSTASIYRRTLVMVKVDDDVSYGVDFFRVKGGNKHEYSLHAQSDELFETSGLNITKQVDENGNYVGTLAGADVPYGDDSASAYERGYTWLKNVRYDKAPEREFSADFKIKDFQNVLEDNRNLHLRVTMLNDFELSRVAICGGSVPPKKANDKLPETIEYMIAERKGTNLDSLFTTVLEPYKGTRYIESMTAVPITVKTGTESGNDAAHAIKVCQTNGRTDYIVYASNNSITYTVTDADGATFDFRGFVGVYSINSEKELIYRYVQDGDILGAEINKASAYTGKVKDFTHDLSFENKINVKFDNAVETEDLAGRIIIVENDGVENGAYFIEGAKMCPNGTVDVDIGTVTPIRSFRTNTDVDGGYTYNITNGRTVTIPTSFSEGAIPKFDAIGEYAVSAGSVTKFSVTAKSPENLGISYSAALMPRGASLDAQTGEITWKPTDSQVKSNHFAITATDSLGRKATVHFYVTVYGSTTGGGGGSGGGGGGGGGTPTEPSESTEPTEPTEPSGSTEPSETAKRFKDIENVPWAIDAINELAASNVIKGTSEDTFSPNGNITRADFSVLLVRAFNLKSDKSDNFDDVRPEDYFAESLAIAKNTGIVGGIGNNKFAPRMHITREDMMLLFYRALTKLGVLFDEDENEIEIKDIEAVSDYAKEAVRKLVAAGLVNGSNGYIKPKSDTTRAEGAVLIKRALDYAAQIIK